MDILEKMREYVKNEALNDVKELNTELIKKLPWLDKSLIAPMKGGYTKKKFRKKGGAVQSTNAIPISTIVTGPTKRNAPLRQKKSMISPDTILLIFLSMLTLEALTRTRNILPQGMSFVQILSFFGKDAYVGVLMPFIVHMQTVFTFLKKTTVPNVIEGVSNKIVATLSGADAVADANRLFTTFGNVLKVSGWMFAFVSSIKGIVKDMVVKDTNDSKENIIEDKDVEILLRDIIKDFEERFNKVPKYTYMKVPPESILMTIVSENDVEGFTEKPM